MKKQSSNLNIRLLFIFFVSMIFFCGCGKKEEILFFTEEKTETTKTDHLEETENVSPFPTKKEEPQTIFVDVSGAVKNPGVYELQEGSRVFQAIESAGGLASDACCDRVNLASILQDAQHIFIPSEKDIEVMQEDLSEELKIQETLPYEEVPDENGKINVNEATLEQLVTLTGIGETRAKAILAYRAEHGKFFSIEEIMNVQGIKEGTFAKIKDDIVVR